MDIYRRLVKPNEEDPHYLRVSKAMTLFWGVFACIVAYFASALGSLIEVVNLFGSYFYGSLLGVFALAFFSKRCPSNGAFFGLFFGMAAVATVAINTEISFLWYNLVGVLAVVLFGNIWSLIENREP
jgi:Na+/proline symporter